jgi:hypothetical protein
MKSLKLQKKKKRKKVGLKKSLLLTLNKMFDGNTLGGFNIILPLVFDFKL